MAFKEPAGRNPLEANSPPDAAVEPDPQSREDREGPTETQRWWHLVAVVAMTTMAVVTMRGWLAGDLLPPYDFAGYASAVEDVRDTVLRFGHLPAWSSKWFAGSTRFTSTVKELAAFPLALWLDPIRAVQIMVLITKILAALAMYVLFWRLFTSPAAGIVAGCAYACSVPASYHTSVHLHVSISYVVFPLFFVASVELLRRRRGIWAVGLGVLGACQFSNNYLLSPVCLASVVLLLIFRPWRRVLSQDNPFRDRQLVRRWCALLGLALGVFVFFAGSQLAWLAADLRNHALHSREHVAWGVEVFIEHSPFAYFNRANWLGPWLADHHPPGMLLFPEEPLRNQRHYLGIVAMIVCGGGWFAARRDYSLRRWYQVFGLLFLFQYWLSMGPRTLVWQVARTFHWSDSADHLLQMALTGAALACLAASSAWVFHRRRRRGQTGRRLSAWIEAAPALALILLFASHSLFDAASHVFPPLQAMRAPGRFFELAPFACYCLVGVGLVAIQRSLGSRNLGHALIAVTAALLVVDAWPGAAAFRRGTPLEPVREFREFVATLPAEDGTLRIALFPWDAAVAESFVSGAFQGGVAWSWLSWQAGKYWTPYFRGTMLWLADEFDPDERAVYRPVSHGLGSIGRLKYYLGHPGRDPGPPWKVRAANEAFALWERPDVLPMARGYRSYLLFVGKNDLLAALSLYRAAERNLLSVSGAERLSGTETGLLDGAAVVLCEAPAGSSDDQSLPLAKRYADKLFVAGAPEFSERFSSFLSDWRQAELVDVRYSRPSPTHIALAADTGEQSAFIFVSEAYHPWWHAAVDSRPTPVLRANMTFMAVPVPPGNHRIDLRFERPVLVEVGDRVTLLSWAALAGALLASGATRLIPRRP